MKQELKIALYSIKPVYSDQIMNGSKTVELRKRLPASKLDYILIYSSAPTSKILGYAEVVKVHEKDVPDMWKFVEKNAGIEKESYMSYFKGSDKAFAFELGEVRRFIKPFSLSEVKANLLAPQSFTYISQTDFKRVCKRKTKVV